jgi:CPA2 family monovalent cation:H+ antiporter-2
VPEKADAEAEDAAREAMLATEKGHAVLVGYGRVGSLVGKDLAALSQPFKVIEDNDRLAHTLEKDGIEVVSGNAVEAHVLERTNIDKAHMLFVAIPNFFEGAQIISRARARNPGLIIVARAHSEEEVAFLTRAGANAVIMGEREIARGMIEHAFGGAEHVITPSG